MNDPHYFPSFMNYGVTSQALHSGSRSSAEISEQPSDPLALQTGLGFDPKIIGLVERRHCYAGLSIRSGLA